MPLYEIDSFAKGLSYYVRLPGDVRRGQIERIISLHDRFYPSPRLSRHRADDGALSIGRSYLVFREVERVRESSRHFDLLVREASVFARGFPAHLRSLATG